MGLARKRHHAEQEPTILDKPAVAKVLAAIPHQSEAIPH